MTSLCFCSSFTPPAHRPAPARALTSCRPLSAPTPASAPARAAVPKRSRAPPTCIDGGTLPDFEDGLPTEIQFFGRGEATTPDTAPSTPQDPEGAVEMALFPLQLVLNPGSNIPLHIFEMRYRLLFNQVHDGDSRMGIVLYDNSSDALASIGCAADLTRFEPLPDGRIMTNNVGRSRFRIVRILEEKPYTRAMVQLISDKEPTENLLPIVMDVWQALQDVLRLSNKLYDKVLQLSPDVTRLAPSEDGPGGVAAAPDEKVPDGWPSPKRVEEFSFFVCQVLDMPLKEQQILLQIDDTGMRLRRQHKMLATARKYLAAQVTIKEAGLKD